MAEQPIQQLIRYYIWKYERIAAKAKARAAAIAQACKNTELVRSDRRKRLCENAAAAHIDASAANYMLECLPAAQAQLGHDSLRAWLIERIDTFDWRNAYRTAKLLPACR